MILNGFSLAREKWQVLLYPAVLDLISLVFTFGVAGYSMQQTVTYQIVSIGPLFPSINDILTEPNELLAMNVEMNVPGAGITAGLLLFLLLFMFVGVLVEAGFFHLIWQGASGNGDVTFENFLTGAKRFWVRFLLLYVLLIVLLIVPLILMSFFGLFGLILVGIGVLILRVMFIYLEFTIIADDIGIFDAIGQSFAYFKETGGELIVLLFAMAAATALIGFIVNYLAMPALVILMTPVYLFVVTGFMFALALMLEKARSLVFPTETT
ncbi:hypothetical protein [Salisediminibacterium beveridgei]|uniref:Permease, major facilitator superfamily n=1 Tax=Salisediminibacterium beveridgei TaxID=632773 RepID=A0A1D7QR94_9BACI|nr:hypothetical protein [Salisediminibacterium beveridgei]AOM81516.1 Permease, major facilitator superfamily [Salisediminibacterium beveridgei]